MQAQGEKREIFGFLKDPFSRMMLLFGIEGMCFQYMASTGMFGNNIFASNLGASDAQIGLIQTATNAVSVILLLPAGIWADRMKSSKGMPMLILCFLGAMYFLYGLTPWMGSFKMTYFFVFLGLTAGVLATYNAQWQGFFGDVTREGERNQLYSFRNRFMFMIGTAAPLVFGMMLARATGSGKLTVLQIFYFINGGVALLGALVISRIRGGQRSPEQLQAMKRFSARDILEVLRALKGDARFLSFFLCILYFHLAWHTDFSMWYIGQTVYCGLDEAQLSYVNAVTSVLQLAAIGFWAWLNQKKTVHFTILFGALGQAICPLVMMFSASLPGPERPWVFLGLAAAANMTNSCIPLCLVQMLLAVVPVRNRALAISLYTMAITLSNAVMPFLGVQIYTALGADWQAFYQYNSLVSIWRFS
ncbi:MAG: MFS transporter, partial [Christensenellaceae bacterium]|nr:MFS transporter [Christensenellaceae bacterium]